MNWRPDDWWDNDSPAGLHHYVNGVDVGFEAGASAMLAALIKWLEERCTNHVSYEIYDANKREIYEGDLLKDDGGNIGEVIWNQDDCSFCLDFPHVETQPLDKEFSQSMEVVGNIYEKPRKKK